MFLSKSNNSYKVMSLCQVRALDHLDWTMRYQVLWSGQSCLGQCHVTQTCKWGFKFFNGKSNRILSCLSSKGDASYQIVSVIGPYPYFYLR